MQQYIEIMKFKGHFGWKELPGYRVLCVIKVFWLGSARSVPGKRWVSR